VTVLNSLRRIDDQIPSNASIISFGHPIWEPGYIPVFAALWDLRGGIDAQTTIDPPLAYPFMPGTACGGEGVTFDNNLLVPYKGDSPLWFINAATDGHYRVTSQDRCQAVVAEFGVPPFIDPDPF
jgi:hypothetical protein